MSYMRQTFILEWNVTTRPPLSLPGYKRETSEQQQFACKVVKKI